MRTKLLFALLIIMAVAFLVGMFFVVFFAAKSVEENLTPETPSVPPTESLAQEPVEPTEEPSASAYPYADTSAMTYAANTNMVGRLTIKDTVINYPVMQTPRMPDYYLVRDFNGESSLYGCPYVQSNCDLIKPSDNIIIYSHYMKDGTMFAGLEKYKDKSFCRDHKVISFELEGTIGKYEILSVMALPFTTDDKTSFKFYEFVDAYDPKSFSDFVAKCKALSLYETGVTAAYGDKLLTLATSEYNGNNERLVIVAKRL